MADNYREQLKRALENALKSSAFVGLSQFEVQAAVQDGGGPEPEVEASASNDGSSGESETEGVPPVAEAAQGRKRRRPPLHHELRDHELPEKRPRGDYDTVPDPFGGGTIVIETASYVVTVKQRDFRRAQDWNVDDAIYTCFVRSKEEGSAPKVREILEAFDKAIHQIVTRLQEAYKTKHGEAIPKIYQLYVTISEHNTRLITGGLNTGRYPLDGPPGEITETAMQILLSYLRSNQTLDLSNGIDIDFTVIGIPTSLRRTEAGKRSPWSSRWRPRRVVQGGLEDWTRVPQWIIKCPVGRREAKNDSKSTAMLFASSCLLVSMLLGLIKLKKIAEFGLDVIRGKKIKWDIIPSLKMQQRKKQENDKKILPVKLGQKLWSGVCALAKIMKVSPLGPHDYMELLPKFCELFKVKCNVYSALNPKVLLFSCGDGELVDTVSLLEESRGSRSHIDFIDDVELMRRLKGSTCATCGKILYHRSQKHSCPYGTTCNMCERDIKECPRRPLKRELCLPCGRFVGDMSCLVLHASICKQDGTRCKKCNTWLSRSKKAGGCSAALLAHAPLCSPYKCHECWLHKKQKIGKDHVCFVRGPSKHSAWPRMASLSLLKTCSNQQVIAGGVILEETSITSQSSLIAFHPDVCCRSNEERKYFQGKDTVSGSLAKCAFGKPMTDHGDVFGLFIRLTQLAKRPSVLEQLLAFIFARGSDCAILVEEICDLEHIKITLDQHHLQPMVHARDARISFIVLPRLNIKFFLRSNHIRGSLAELQLSSSVQTDLHWFPERYFS